MEKVHFFGLLVGKNVVGVDKGKVRESFANTKKCN